MILRQGGPPRGLGDELRVRKSLAAATALPRLMPWLRGRAGLVSHVCVQVFYARVIASAILLESGAWWQRPWQEAVVETTVEQALKRGFRPHDRGFVSGLPRSGGERRSRTGS
jgi:hypothetical protein